MAGVVTTRQKLREALQNARAKRQRLNELRIVLLDTMNEEGDRYGVSAEAADQSSPLRTNRDEIASSGTRGTAEHGRRDAGNGH